MQGRSKGRAARAAALSIKFRGANLMINIVLCLILSVKIAPLHKKTSEKRKKIRLRVGAFYKISPLVI
jgi:hypothetical protein